MLVVYSPECTGYSTPGHPESPERVKRIYAVLKEKDFRFVPAEPATKKDILLVHTVEHYEKVRSRDYSDVETPPIDIKYPLLSAGAAIKAAKLRGFALARPPGHHAGRSSLEGFCYFNNLAIAVRKLGRKTAILDLDVHHGNGTQEIFMGDESVIYVSLHQAPLYPMTGLKSEKNCYNFPLFSGTDEKTYLKMLEKAMVIVSGFRPEILAVSMGFDTFMEDPLGGLRVTERGYEKIGKMIKELNLPAFIALEGGYSSQIGELCWNFLKML